MNDRGVAERLDEILGGMPDMDVTHMFSGHGYLMNGNMCVGIGNDQLVFRLGIDGWATIANKPPVWPMNLTGRVMRGWAMVAPDGIAEDQTLKRYVEMALFSVPGCRMIRGKSYGHADPSFRRAS